MSENNEFKIQQVTTLGFLQTGLETLLCDSVNHGASIGFLAPLTSEEAGEYWQNVERELHHNSRILLVALRDQQVVGSIQLALCMKKNAPHRADVEKLFVHTEARGQGIGRQLVMAIENIAKEYGRTLLVLDTRTGDVASELYRSCGFQFVGMIPDYVVDPESKSGMSSTTYFYKQLT